MLSLAFIVCGYLLAAAMWPFGEHAINNFLKILKELALLERCRSQHVRSFAECASGYSPEDCEWDERHSGGMRACGAMWAGPLRTRLHHSKLKGLCVQQFPYQVQLEINTANPTSSSVCGGTLLSTAYVVTAAHCFYGFNITSVVIYAGSVAISGADSTAQSSLPVCCASSFSQTGT